MGNRHQVAPGTDPSRPVTTLLLVRHARSEFNVEGRVQGGGRLHSLGRLEAASLTSRLRTEPIDVIYASPTTRTLQTARAIARRRGLPIHRTGLLADIDFGVFAGMLALEARARDPDLWSKWRAAPHTVRFPGGEGLSDLRRRMERFLEKARTWGNGRTVLAVTHESPVRVAACIAMGLDDSHHHEWVAATASITTIRIAAQGLRMVQPYADTRHLLGSDAA